MRFIYYNKCRNKKKKKISSSCEVPPPSASLSGSITHPHSAERLATTSPNFKGGTRPIAISTCPLLEPPKRSEQSDGYAARTLTAGGDSVGSAFCWHSFCFALTVCFSVCLDKRTFTLRLSLAAVKTAVHLISIHSKHLASTPQPVSRERQSAITYRTFTRFRTR